MTLSGLLSTVLSVSKSKTETPATASSDDDAASPTAIVSECRSCGTNVSVETVQCPACDGGDIVTYSIE